MGNCLGTLKDRPHSHHSDGDSGNDTTSVEEKKISSYKLCLLLVDIRDFRVLRAVGQGSFYKVVIGQSRGTGKFYALKYISKDELISSKRINGVLKERKILEYLCPHPFLVNLRYAFQDDANIYMVTDLMLGGDLRYYLDNVYNYRRSISPKSKQKSMFSCFPFTNEGKITQKEHRIKLTKLMVPELVVIHFMAQCCISLHYLHTMGIVHRDIKPENLLLDSFGFIHISDFNVAGEREGFRLSSRSGTVSYMAPELLKRSGYRGSIDWWGLGIVMYELMFGRRPFKGNTKLELIKAIMKGQFPIVKGKYSNECVDFLKCLLKMNPKRRMGFEDGNHYHLSTTFPNQKCNCLDDKNDENHSNELELANESTFKSIMRHDFFKKIDWIKLSEKQIPSPYRPNPSTFHFDLMHEVNAVLKEKNQFKFKKLKNTETNIDTSESMQKIEQEFGYYNWEEA